VKKVRELHPQLSERDVRFTPMGVSGVDVQLSAEAFSKFPYAVECKRRAKFTTLYNEFEQQKKEPGEPLLVYRGDHKPALAIITLDHFMELLKK